MYCLYNTWFSPVKEVGMVGALAQLHQDILQAHLLHLARPVHNVDVLHEDLGVPLALHPRHRDENLGLLLGQQALLDVGFKTTQEEGLEDAVETGNKAVVAQAGVCVEPLVEVFGRTERKRFNQLEFL